MLNIQNGQVITGLNYVQHLERGYCANHPDVVAGTKTQVVDRAVKQLLTMLQATKFEIVENDTGIEAHIGFLLEAGATGMIRVEKATARMQYYDPSTGTWKDIGSGDDRLAVSEDPDGLILTLTNGTESGQLRVEKATGWLQFWNTDYEEWQYVSDASSHIADTSVHHDYGPNACTFITTDTTLTPAQVMSNRMIVCTGSCTVTLPTNFPGCRVTIWANNVDVHVKAHTDPMWGALIALPSVAASVYEIHPVAQAYWQNITLRGCGASNGDLWLVENMIGTWAAV